MPANDLEGKIAIITGAAGGLGRAIVKAFAERGMRIAACDVKADALDAMERTYGRERMLALAFDISDPAACATNVQKVVDCFGGLHILNIVIGIFFFRVGFMMMGGFGAFGLGSMLYGLISLVAFILWILLMVKAYQHEKFEVPIAAGIAKSLSGN